MILEYNGSIQTQTSTGAFNAYTRSNHSKNGLQMANLSIPRTSGIYVIANTKNGKVYIGQAQDFRHRWQDHRNNLRLNRHRNIHLQRAWNKDGEKAFRFKILEYCRIENLDEREQHFLNIYMPKGICYNIAVDVRASGRGLKRSPETLEKMRIVSTGRKCSDYSKAITSLIHKGKVLSAETRAKVSASHMGIKPNPESIIKRIMNLGNYYEVFSPNGEIFETRNLNQFCKDNGLSQSRMSAVSCGKQDNHRGWKVTRTKK